MLPRELLELTLERAERRHNLLLILLSITIAKFGVFRIDILIGEDVTNTRPSTSHDSPLSSPSTFLNRIFHTISLNLENRK